MKLPRFRGVFDVSVDYGSVAESCGGEEGGVADCGGVQFCVDDWGVADAQLVCMVARL